MRKFITNSGVDDTAISTPIQEVTELPTNNGLDSY